MAVGDVHAGIGEWMNRRRVFRMRVNFRPFYDARARGLGSDCWIVVDGLRLPKAGALWEGWGCPYLSRKMGGGAGEERERGGWKMVGEWLLDG